MAWLLDKKELKNPKSYQTWRGHRVLAYEDYGHSVFGADGPKGVFNVFGDIGRTQWIFAGDDLADPADVILFADDSPHLSDANLTHLVEHLKTGKNVIILNKGGVSLGDGATLLTQLGEKLGAPTKTALGPGQTLSWGGIGQIFVMSDVIPFDNSKVPPPERAPIGAQVQWLSRLNQLIESAMPK